MNNTQPTIDLLKGVIGKSLRKVIHDLGCPDLPSVLLSDEQRPFLQARLGDLPADQELHNNLLAGKVVQVGHAPEGQSLFTVRFLLRRLDCYVTLSYYRDEWKLYSVDSVRSPRREWSRLIVGAIGGAIVAAVIAFAISSVHTANANVVAEAKQQGYIVLTEAQYQQQIGAATSGQAGKTTAAGSSSNGGSSADNGQQITFNMQEGMTTSDLTSFLKQQGLIQDQAAFNQELTQKGIDTMIRPGNYVFKKGMTEDQILSVLQGQGS